MRQPPVFDFVSGKGDATDNKDHRQVREHGDDDDAPAFEPTRDGWRAYEAWCKQIRADWDTDD